MKTLSHYSIREALPQQYCENTTFSFREVKKCNTRQG